VRYVAIEGIDGSGKSSVVTATVSRLRSLGIPAHDFAYMALNDWGIGRQLHRCFMNPASLRAWLLERVQPFKLLLFQCNAAARWRRLLAGVERDAVMIGDRSIVSLLIFFAAAYGGGARLRAAVRSANVTPVPSDVVYLDLAPATALERIRLRGPTDFNEDIDALDRAASLYEQHLQQLWFRPQIHRLDASEPVDQLARRVAAIVMREPTRPMKGGPA
jgi:thymidylate kinase